jgi:sRNA-binding regulator protein Hfq
MTTISKLKPGDVLYDVHSHKMGNTTASTVGVWTVHVIEVFDRYIVASWNGNPPERMFKHTISKLRVKKPVLVKSGFGKRLATRAELKAMKEKANAEH